MEPRGRGRARGTARASSQSGEPPAGQRPGNPWNIPRGNVQQGPAPVQQQAPTQWVVRPQMPAPSASVGRGSRLGGGAAPEPPQISGARQGADSQGRGGGNGGVRGRSLKSEIIHTRPKDLVKQGTSGKPIQLISNYFQLLQAGKWGLFQYRVDFNPDLDHTGQRKRFMWQAMQGVVRGYLFDGTVLYSSQRIQPDPLERFVENEAGDKFRITIRMVGEVAWGDYHYIQLFNILIRSCLKHMQLELIQRNYYDSSLRMPIPDHKLELWPGFFTSMRQHEQDILLNCELKFKFFRTDNCYDMFIDCRSSNVRAEFQEKIIGQIVFTDYNNKTLRIDDVDYSKTPSDTFMMKDGSQQTYVKYYKDRYNINVTVLNQPMLVSRSKPREIRAGMPEVVYLVPELCRLTGLTDRQRDNFQLMRALSDHTRVAPLQRMAKLTEFSKRLRNCPAAVEELKKWDFKLADQLVRFTGRLLPQETIVGGKNANYPSGSQADWTRELRSLPMYSPIKISNFAVICPAKLKNSTIAFIDCLLKSARGMQWDMGSQPRIFDIPDDRAYTYLEKIENVISTGNVDMIMCIVPNNSADRYSAIKKKCCVDRGIPSQVIVAKNLISKGLMSIATKVAIQLNCKVGGAPWTTVIPLSGLMVVGYDVCRDTAKKGKCFGAMVASLDKQLTRYFNHTSEHTNDEELSFNFGAFMLLACQKYKENNGKYPDRILIYRDGVGDGQLAFVIEQEVEDIKKKLTQEIYKNNDLKMAFVIVSKRINTRFFTAEGNPLPGTVVDDVVTLPNRYDFFIVSQCVRQGTVSPTSYNVIWNSMGLTPDKMQILTYKLCHMYFNWSGTVRVPAPCQYAHKLAFLTARSLHRTANRALENVLYYL